MQRIINAIKKFKIKKRECGESNISFLKVLSFLLYIPEYFEMVYPRCDIELVTIQSDPL